MRAQDEKIKGFNLLELIIVVVIILTKHVNSDIENGKLKADAPPAQLYDLEKDVIQPFLDKSNVINCKPGDRVLKKGNVAQNMFVVLSGELEVRDGDLPVARLTKGDLMGEVAFLMNIPRSADVYAIADGTSVLSLSESAVRKHFREDPAIAAQMMLNISKILCQKLLA